MKVYGKNFDDEFAQNLTRLVNRNMMLLIVIFKTITNARGPNKTILLILFCLLIFILNTVL